MVNNKAGHPVLLGIVVIGRNEGKRLETCLSSVLNKGTNIVYVDSGSTDDSIEVARKTGSDVVELNLEVPFTAARARNAGFSRLQQIMPGVKYVQFIDGDCEVHSAWLETAINYLETHPDIAVVCGRRRERYPSSSIYNLLCDIEWDTPVGKTKACGGDALVRAKAFERVGGFDPSLIAGEEPELCVRLRDQGWKIWRLDSEMTIHDANITQFAEWWCRSVRAGYAYAEGASLHGKPPEGHWVKETRRALLWGMVMPAMTIVSIYIFGILGASLFIVYPLQLIRLSLKSDRQFPLNFTIAFFLVIGKFSESYGVLRYYFRRIVRKRNSLIEYK